MEVRVQLALIPELVRVVTFDSSHSSGTPVYEFQIPPIHLTPKNNLLSFINQDEPSEHAGQLNRPSFDPLSSGPSNPRLSLPAFLDLPDEIKIEIKIEILKEILPIDSYFSNSDFSSAQHRLNLLLWKRPSTFQTLVVPFLAAVPEFQGLINDVFYSSNTICIGNEPGEFKHPQSPIEQFVKRMELTILMTDEDFSYFRKLGRGDFGFKNLVQVNITINGISADFLGVNMLVVDDVAIPEAAVESMKDYLKAMEHIEICAKRISVTYEHADLCVKLSEDSGDVTKISDKWAEMLLGKISVTGQEKVRWSVMRSV
jgi:hypothetical protein